MLYEIIDASTLPRGLRPGDQRDWQRPVVSAMAEQTGIPALRFLHLVGRGETKRTPSTPTVTSFMSPRLLKLRPQFPNRTTEAANALRKADEGLKSALGDLCDLLP